MEAYPYESNRLNALSRYNGFYSELRDPFHRLTALAAEWCETPFALITNVDRDGTWIKSVYGIAPSESAIEHSFCAQTIQNDSTLVINDAARDERFKNHPCVTSSPFIRFYAGTPLKTSDEFRIGTLCVLDQKPRELNPIHRKSLEALARAVMLELELKLHQKKLIQMESAFLETSRLATAGELAMEIAHEICSPLSVIEARMGYMQSLIKKGTQSDEILMNCTTKVRKVTQRIGKIVHGLKCLSRTDLDDPILPLFLKDVVEDSVSYFEEKIYSEGILLQIDAVDPTLRVLGRGTQISQVLMNLLLNARDAVEKTNPKWIRIQFQITDERIQIRVSDSGPPIDPKIKDQIFKPFFTTKKAGKGTGLGLSVSRSLLEPFEAKLVLENEPEKVFVIDLKRV